MWLLNRILVWLAFCSVALGTHVAHAQNYSDIWWNPNESGWGITLADHETELFGVWYTYAANGSPTWYVITGGAFSQGKRLFSGDVYQTTGPAYNTLFNTNLVTATKVGTASFDFAPPGLATGVAVFTYTIGTLTQSKQIQRQPFGNAAPNWGTDYTDIWWNSNESGWGMTLAQHGNNIFGVWYTYDAAEKPLWVVMPGVTFNGNNSFSGTLYTTTGPYFAIVPFNPADIRVTTVGSATITFNGRNGTIVFTVNGFTQTKQITSQPFGNSAPSVAPLSIQIVPLPDATAGTFYAMRAATASGGSPPYSFSLDSFVYGTPPIGTIIELGGFLTGTPSSTYTTRRSFPFRICVSDLVRTTVCDSTEIFVNPAASALTGTIQWTIGNQCNNGEVIQYKMHDRTNGWVWPSATTHYPISYGQSFTNTLSCVPGGQVCVGARSASGGLSWGVGFSGSGGCSNCCGTCGQGSYSYSFGCPGSPPPGGAGYYANWTCGSSGQCANVMGGAAGSRGPFCSLAGCQAWGNINIPFGYSCSTQPTFTPSPGGSQCTN